jgi:hypothetical protein
MRDSFHQNVINRLSFPNSSHIAIHSGFQADSRHFLTRSLPDKDSTSTWFLQASERLRFKWIDKMEKDKALKEIEKNKKAQAMVFAQMPMQFTANTFDKAVKAQVLKVLSSQKTTKRGPKTQKQSPSPTAKQTAAQNKGKSNKTPKPKDFQQGGSNQSTRPHLTRNSGNTKPNASTKPRNTRR